MGNSEQFFGRASSVRVAGRRAVEVAAFRTISSADWSAAFRMVRAEVNVIAARIRAAAEKRRALS